MSEAKSDRCWRAAILVAMVCLVLAIDLAGSYVSVAFQSLAPSEGPVEQRGGPVAMVMAAARVLAWLGKALLASLIILVALLLIERRFGKKDREAKDYLTGWATQITFLTIAHLADSLSRRFLPLPAEPLFALPAASHPMIQAASALAFFLLALFVADLLHYWTHRAQHRFGFLWKFHAVHHCARDLDVLHSFSHPVELTLRYFMIAMPLGFLIGFPKDPFLLVAAFIVVQTKLNHMNAPINYGRFGKLLVDNRYHFIHHSSDPGDFDRNFADVFPVIDKMFGTYKAPRGDVLPATGLAGYEAPMKLRHYLLAVPARPAEAARPRLEADVVQRQQGGVTA